ncbi:MAG: hypothetical protein MHPSP_002063, partial [Paramarteilia canceri]
NSQKVKAYVNFAPNQLFPETKGYKPRLKQPLDLQQIDNHSPEQETGSLIKYVNKSVANYETFSLMDRVQKASEVKKINGFVYFMKEKRPEIQRIFKEKESSVINMIGAKYWKLLNENQRKYYACKAIKYNHRDMLQ